MSYFKNADHRKKSLIHWERSVLNLFILCLYLSAQSCGSQPAQNCPYTIINTHFHRRKGLLLLFLYMWLLLQYQHSWLEGEDSGFLKQHLILGYTVTVSGARSQQHLTNNIGGDSNMGRSNYLATTGFIQNIQFTNIQIFSK